MSEIKNYRDLTVWKKSMSLVKETYKIAAILPDGEKFGLVGQMQRAAVSIPSNIAEGQQRINTKEFVHFLSIARGSNAELQTQLEIGLMLNYYDKHQVKAAYALSEEVSKMLNTLIERLDV